MHNLLGGTLSPVNIYDPPLMLSLHIPVSLCRCGSLRFS